MLVAMELLYAPLQNNKNVMKKILIGVIIISLYGVACTKKTYKPGATTTVKMSNGWWVNIQLGGSNLTSTPTFFTTYNTAANTIDSMWVDDLHNGYNFKCTAAVNYSNLTFSTTGSANQYDTNRVIITNGKVLPNAGHSRTGNPTDSIYMNANFSDDPTDTYIIAGTARTGFPADDY